MIVEMKINCASGDMGKEIIAHEIYLFVCSFFDTFGAKEGDSVLQV